MHARQIIYPMALCIRKQSVIPNVLWQEGLCDSQHAASIPPDIIHAGGYPGVQAAINRRLRVIRAPILSPLI
jgi:hypothetical protein